MSRIDRMHLGFVVLLGIVVFVEIFSLMSLLHIPTEILVNVATLIALAFPIYAWSKGRLDKERDSIDEIRIWSLHFQAMTEYVEKLTPEQALGTREIHISAETAADKLATAITHARAASEKLATPTYALIRELRLFARDKPRDGGILLYNWKQLYNKAHEVQRLATDETKRFRLQFTAIRWILLVTAAALTVTLIWLRMVGLS